MDSQQTAQALSLVIQDLNSLIAAKEQFRRHLSTDVMRVARGSEIQSTIALVEGQAVEIERLRAAVEALRAIREGQ